MKKKLYEFFRDEQGATAVEYGIMIAAIAAVIIGVVISIGNRTNTAFQKVEEGLSSNPIN